MTGCIGRRGPRKRKASSTGRGAYYLAKSEAWLKANGFRDVVRMERKTPILDFRDGDRVETILTMVGNCDPALADGVRRQVGQAGRRPSLGRVVGWTKQDLWGADLMAKSADRLALVQSKGLVKGSGWTKFDVRLAIEAFRSARPFPPFVELLILVWTPRVKEPLVVKEQDWRKYD